VQTTDAIFQEIALPAGTYSVTFSYSPPYSVWAFVACLLGVVLLIGLPWVARRRQVLGSIRDANSPFREVPRSPRRDEDN
jgi:hypothetical protein